MFLIFVRKWGSGIMKKERRKCGMIHQNLGVWMCRRMEVIMFNLLRMDLYRMKRGKSVYVCLGILLMGIVATLSLIWLVATPQGQQVAVNIGMFTSEDLAEVPDTMAGVDTLVMLRQTSLDGGVYNLVFGIWVMLFVCMDYQSGFIKNVMAVHQNRWNYVVSKIVTAGIVSFCYLIAQYVLVLIMNRLLGNMAPCSPFGDVLFYLTWAWLLTVAFAALTILVCVWTRSVAAGTLTAVLLGTGTVQGPLYALLNMVHAGGWMKYTIYHTLDLGPNHYAAPADLYVYVVGVGFLVLYAVVAGIVLRKQDI